MKEGNREKNTRYSGFGEKNGRNSLYSNGKIVCDMEVEELAHFEPLAHIEGNVSSKRLHIEEGAVVKGTLNCL